MMAQTIAFAFSLSAVVLGDTQPASFSSQKLTRCFHADRSQRIVCTKKRRHLAPWSRSTRAFDTWRYHTTNSTTHCHRALTLYPPPNSCQVAVELVAHAKASTCVSPWCRRLSELARAHPHAADNVVALLASGRRTDSQVKYCTCGCNAGQLTTLKFRGR